ncbi:MAG: putative phage major head protein [Thermomicrobiales bacterium]|nr:putative phage major head protein [Thermomicrobiales bacterium]
MSAITNTVQTYDRKGLRESLSDLISNISPEDTPLVSNIGTESVKQTLHEWQTDSLAAVDTANAQIQGDDISSYPSAAATVRVGNYTQILRKLVLVADTVEAVDKAGRKSEFSYQTMKRAKEMKRDWEAILLNNIGGSAGNSSTAAKTATLGAWIKTNVDKHATGGNPTYTSGVPAAARTDGTLRAYTEDILKNVAQLIWASGGDVKVNMLGPVNKVRAASFSGVATRNYDLSTPKPTATIGAVDVYVSNWGVIRYVPNRFQREADGWFLDYEYIKVGVLRPYAVKALGKSGDASKAMLVKEALLIVKNEAALGLAADLTTS